MSPERLHRIRLDALEQLHAPGIFDPTYQRLISGCATTNRRNANGNVLAPHLARFELPVVLLWAHRWLHPIGLVTAAKPTAYGLEFEACVGNRGLPLVDDRWEAITDGRAPAVSVGIAPNAREGRPWHWLELSVVEVGANREAMIEIVKEAHRPGFIYADGRNANRDTIFRDVYSRVSCKPHLDIHRTFTR